MKSTHYFLLAFLFVACLCIVFFYNDKSNVNLLTVSADVVISAEKLTESFLLNENEANETYKEKVIEVTGIVKKVNFKNNRKTIVLHSNNENFNVMCDMQFDVEKKVNDTLLQKKIIIKGICKGFLHDVVMLNCVLINIKSDE